jgi:branched-chain amino acid transport system substrate-binding protein
MFRGTSRTIVAALAAAGIGIGAAAAQAPTVYKFGAMLPLTGNAALSGEFERQAIDLAVEDFHASGALPGAQFQPVYEDMAANPRVAVPAIQKLINVDNVPFSLIGYSSVTLAAAPIAERAKVLLLNSGASSARLAKASPYVFNSIPLADLQAKVILWHAVNVLKMKRIAFYYRNDDLGNDLIEYGEPYAKKIGATVLRMESFTPNAPDHKAQLAKLRADRPEAVFVVAAGNETGNIVKQAREIDFRTQWISYAGYENVNTLTIGAAAAEGGLYTVASLVGPDGNLFPAAEAFYKKFEQRYGKPREKVDYVAPQFYEGARLYMEAVRILAREGKPVSGENLRQAFLKIDGFESVFGKTRFRPNGTVLKPIALKTVRDNKFQIVKVYSIEEVARMPD